MKTDQKSDQLKKLEEKRDLIEAKIQKVKALQNKEIRKKETRRNILIGKCILWHVDQGEISEEKFFSWLDKYLENSRDRQLFGL